jgi:hypothetical protein
MTAHVIVERREIDAPPGNPFRQVGDPSCTTDPDTCCQGSGSSSSSGKGNCLPPGQALQVEKTTYAFPAGSRLIRRYCEMGKLCCPGSGSASGGKIQTTCCPNPVPATLTLTVSGGCLSGAYPVSYDAGLGVWRWTGSVAGQSVEIRLACVQPENQWFVSIACNGVTIFSTFLAAEQCDPLVLTGSSTTTAASPCCAAGTSLNVNVSEGGADASTGCLVLLQLEEWELPPGSKVSHPFCETDPACCSNDDDTPPICEGEHAPPCEVKLPRHLYVTFLNVTGPIQPYLEGFVLPIYSFPPGIGVWSEDIYACGLSETTSNTSVFRQIICHVPATATAENVAFFLSVCRRHDHLEWRAQSTIQRVKPSPIKPDTCVQLQAIDDVACQPGGASSSTMTENTPCNRPVLLFFPGVAFTASGANPPYPSFTADVVVFE